MHMLQSHRDVERALALCSSEGSPSAKPKQILDDAGWRAAVRSMV